MRTSFFFSARGDRAACLREAAGPGLAVETWAWHAGRPRRRVLPPAGEGLYAQPLPLDDGRVLVLRPGRDLVLLTPGQPGCPLGQAGRGGRLLPSPDPGMMAVFSGHNDIGEPFLYPIPAEGSVPRVVARPGIAAGSLHGGQWLDRGRTLGFTHREDGRSRIVAVDLATGAVTPADGDGHLLLAHWPSGRFVAARRDGGAVRLGWGGFGPGGWRLDFPGELNDLDGDVTPLAIDPAGEKVALRVTRGLSTRVYVCEPGRERQRVAVPPGEIFPAARWTGGGLHLVVSGPDRPGNITTVDPGTSECRADPDPGRWAAARAETLPGPEGPIEAVVYGGPAWRQSPRLLVALHGGPHTAWTLGFSTLFQELAAAGVAIVAPNQRGSTGYGRAHRDAIRGVWGGPDLADVSHLARSLAAGRRGLPGLMLLGESYGAYLALLTAAATPGLWSRCVAISAFASPASLLDEGPEQVRSLLTRVEGRGPGDVERVAHRIRARLLILHGAADRKIPLSQPRRIVAALERAGTDVRYVETSGGHDLARDDAARRMLTGFLA